MKIVKIEQLVCEHSQKNYLVVIAHYISDLIYQLHFLKLCPIQKQKILKNCRYLVESCRLSNFLNICFETSIIFQENAIKIIEGIFDLKK